MGPLVIGFVAAVGHDRLGRDDRCGRSGPSGPTRPHRPGQSEVRAATAVGLSTIGITVLAALLLYPVFQAMMLRWWTAGLRFGPLTVTSHLRTGKVYRIYVRFLG